MSETDAELLDRVENEYAIMTLRYASRADRERVFALARLGAEANRVVLDYEARIAELLALLQEISEGKGRYSRDMLIHAQNTIEDMKALARSGIEGVQ
jgi:hypothetical protein